jgi:hypothetical protein
MSSPHLTHLQTDKLTIATGESIYIGPISPTKKEPLTLTINPITKPYTDAPKTITRISRSQAISDIGITFPIGLTPLQIRLSTLKLNLSPSEQEKLGQAAAFAAREATLLPNLFYKKSKFGRDNAHGTLPPAFFINHGNYDFQSKPEVNAADAILSIFHSVNETFITECSIVVQLIFYKALLDYFGKEIFNRYFARSSIRLERNMTVQNPIPKVSHELNTDWKNILEDPEAMLLKANIGDLLYISNISPYRMKHPVGDSPGFNVIYLGKNATGKHEFGSLFTEKRIRHYDEIIDLMVEDYNKAPFSE